MLLRQITQHVRDQNWVAIFIDFLIVVIGVFIGIQVANWNEDRLASELEHELLEGILVDLEDDSSNLANVLEQTEFNIMAGNQALLAAGLEPVKRLVVPVKSRRVGDNFEAPEAEKELPDVMQTRLWTAVAVRYFAVQNDAAMTTLVATGRLGLITDESLVVALQEYAGQWHALESSQTETLRPIRNQLLEAGQQHGLSPFMDVPESEYLRLLKESPRLLGAMRTQLEFTILHRGLLVETQRQNAALIAQIKAAAATY